jgi:sugar lactone lactonase YvrE
LKCLSIRQLHWVAPAVVITALIVAGAAVSAAPQSPNVSVFATGLNNPRGLKFGPDGNLYVAEGGVGGTSINTVGQCTQVPFPVGPYTTDGPSARISRIDSSGIVTTVIDGLPSSQTNLATGGFVSGVADVAFIGNTLYAVIAGAGCSHAVPDFPNSVIRVNDDGSFTQIADLSQFVMNNPVAHPNADDFEPDGTWYGMISLRGNLYAVEPNHGEMDAIDPNGSVSRIVDISATQGHIVPTALALHGNFFIGNLDTFPATAGESNVLKVTPSGNLKVWRTGVMAVLGVAFDQRGRLYVLETFDVPGFPTPFTGDILRIDHSGKVETVASGLAFPTAMTFGPDGNLYVSNFGFGFPAGAGQIVKVTVP